MEVTTLALLLAEKVKSGVVGEIGYRPRSLAVQELVEETPVLGAFRSFQGAGVVSPFTLSGSALVCGGKSILNESSAVEEFREENEPLRSLFKLMYLDLRSTNITCLPANLGSLSKLRGLDLMARESIEDTTLGWRKKDSAAGNKMTMETSSKGGFDIGIYSHKVHVPRYSSVNHPLIQMVLFARTLYGYTLRCLKFVPPKSIIEFTESGLVIMKKKSNSPITVSARKDVHVHDNIATENHSITPELVKNIPNPGEQDYNVDLSTVSVHSGGFAPENTYNLHSFTSAPNSVDHGIAKAEDKTEVTWLMATAALHHATGNRELLSGFTTIKDLFVKAGDGVSMPVCGRGSVITGTLVLPDVWFVPGLTENLVSAPQLTELDHSVGFARGACIIKSATDGVVIGKAHASEDGLFKVEFLNVQPVIAGE